MMPKQTIYSLKQIEQLPLQKIIVIIEGGVYDVTEFIDLHPGGREILLKFNRRDASLVFQKTNHSSQAKSMLSKYCIGVVEGEESRFKKNKAAPLEEKSFLENAKKKLITQEDKFHIHKVLGAFAISHFFIRMLLLTGGTIIFLSTGDNEIFLLNIRHDPAWLFIGIALLHALLSLSSLRFSVPAKASQSKPMIHRLFRAHSITFALRAVACMIIFILLDGDLKTRNIALSIVILISLVSADILSKKLTDKGDRFDTTSSMPYWFGVSLERQQLHKFLYGYGQFLATLVCFTGGYAAALYTLAPIQGAAFGMTLIRKNILSARVYHNTYLASLFLPVPFALFFYPIRVTGGLLLTLFLFYLRTLGINKYVLWLPILTSFNVLLVPEKYKLAFAISIITIAILATLINLVILKTTNSKRLDKNNRIISNKKLANNSIEIIIQTKLPFNLLAGQQVMIRLNDQLENKYTPVWTKHVDETDQSLICIHIYKNHSSKKESTSKYLSEYPAGTVLDLYGPLSPSTSN